MPKKQLTSRVVASLKTTKSQEDFWDTGVRIRGVSFGIRVSRTGTKEYALRYRMNGRYRRMSMGDAAKMGIAEAHAKAIDFAKQLEEGKDPAEIRNQYKVAETCDEVFDLYLKQYAVNKRDKGAEDRRIIERDVRPAIGLKKARDVTRRDIIAILEHISNERDAVVMANRTRALLSKVFNFALEREIIQTSPCVGLSRKKKEKSRDRVLTANELKTILEYLPKEGLILESLFKFALYTAARIGEITGAKWDEIDLKEKLWTLPPERTKNGTKHLLPLPDNAIELLNKLSLEQEESEFLFPSNRSEFIKMRTIQNCVGRIIQKTEIKHFTPHDIRRTVATGLRSLGTGREVVSKILNHSDHSVTAIYDRHRMIPEMRKSLGVWANKLVDLETRDFDVKVFKLYA
jgi:integrase